MLTVIKIKSIIGNFFKLVRVTISIVGLFFSIWAIVLNSYYTAIVITSFIVLIIPVIWKYKYLKFIYFITVLIITISTYQQPIKEINRQIEYLSTKPRDIQNLQFFTLRDKIGIYGLNLLMSLTAYPIYPEISKESFLMIFKTSSNKRTFKSDFPEGSKVINNYINEFNNNLISLDKDINYYETEKRISWSSGYYKLGNKEARYALALNPSNTSFSAQKINGYWEVIIKFIVDCKYPQHSNITIISEPELKVEEGLFWVLQELKWLYPYRAIWIYSYSIKSN